MIAPRNALTLPTALPSQAMPVQYDAQGNWDWSPYAAQGATRPDSFTGMADPFESALEQMFASAPPEIRDQLQVRSGYRSVERQQQLWDEAVAKYGSEAEARRWVAPPGRSQHGAGNAADLGYLDPAAREWAHANAATYGLAFPLGNEPWHVELASARGGGGQPQTAPTGTAPARGGNDPQNPFFPPAGNALAQQQRPPMPPTPPQYSNSLDVAAFMRPMPAPNALAQYGFGPGQSPYMQG